MHQSRKFQLTRWFHKLRSPEPGRWPDLMQAVVPIWLRQTGIDMEELSKIRIKILLIVGSRDDVSIEHAESMAKNMPAADLVVLPHVGHTVPQTARSAVVGLLLNFLLPR